MTKRHRNKNGGKFEQFWKIWKKKNQISALFSTQTPPDDWPDALDCLTIGLFANKYTKLGKTSENLILSQGLSYIKIPLWYVQHAATSIPCRPKIYIWILKAGQAPVAVSYAYAAAMPTGLMVVYSGVEHFLKVNFLLMHPLAQGYRDRYDISIMDTKKMCFFHRNIHGDKWICYHCFMEVSYKLWCIGGVLYWCTYHFLTSGAKKL